MINDRKRYVFGAGILGKRFINLCTDYGIIIDGIIDNNKAVWQTKINGVSVQSPDILSTLDDTVHVFVCCKKSDEVMAQVHDSGIEDVNIVLCNTTVLMMKSILSMLNKRRQTVLFDMNNGLVLGGVESWSIQTAQFLEKRGYDYRLLLPCNRKQTYPYDEVYLERMDVSDVSKARNDKIIDCVSSLLPCVLVTNFIGFNFMAACMAKQHYGDRVQHICVIHNDEEAYYISYLQMKEYIDYCLVISNRIYQKIFQKGYPKEKLKYLTWNIPFNELFCHNYSKNKEILRLGYAGRVTITQKRMDLLLQVLVKLFEYKVDFQIDIAGTGNYIETFKECVQQAGLEEQVHFLGYLDRANIPEFWQDKDIMISCSDWEGHSITQCEAMAAGAVPILTDVSGARDDVEDGVNGYIVEIGAVDQIVDRICYLYDHRELLPKMGKRAYETIKEKYSEEKVEALWGGILESDQ